MNYPRRFGDPREDESLSVARGLASSLLAAILALTTGVVTAASCRAARPAQNTASKTTGTIGTTGAESGKFVAESIAPSGAPHAGVIGSPRFNYGEALQKAVYFYDCQRAGRISHDNRVEWRGDSCLKDGSDVGRDLTGGWYDAGDHVKYNLPMAFAATTLAWSAVEFPDAWNKSGQMPFLRANLRHVSDYFLRCFADDRPGHYVLYGQIGTGASDHGAWASAEVIDRLSVRPSLAVTTEKPGADLAAATAAALASASLVIRSADGPYADRLLTQAEKLWDFADKYRAPYNAAFNAEGYRYSNWPDKLVWGALWLHRARSAKDPAYGGSYLRRAEAEYAALNLAGGYRDAQSWAGVKPGNYVLLARLTGKAVYRDEARRWGDYWSVGLPDTKERSAYTPGGMAYGRDDDPADPQIWGSLRNSCNQAFVALVLARIETDAALRARYVRFAKGQVDYALGANPQRNCYLIGFRPTGTKTFVAAHHRTAYGAWAGFSHLTEKSPLYNVTRPRHLLIGALLGGPDKQDRFTNSVMDFKQCEVAVDYNAGITAALAPLFGDHGGAPLRDFPPKEKKDDEFFVEASVGHGPTSSEIKAWVNNRSAWPARVTQNLSFRYYVVLPPQLRPEQVRVSVRSPDGAIVAPTLLRDEKSKRKSKSDDGALCYALVRFPGVPVFPGGWDSKTGRSTYRKEAVVRLEVQEQEADGATWKRVRHLSGLGLPGLSGEPVRSGRLPLYDGSVLMAGAPPSAH